jgi:K+-sensing histidine kinase KdpD
MEQTQLEVPGELLVRMLRRLAETRQRNYDPTRLYQGEAKLKREEAKEAIIKAIIRHAAAVTRHRAGCTCRRCAQERKKAKRYARLRGLI